MLTIAVCDDEPLFCVRLSEKIRCMMEQFDKDCEIRSFSSGAELLEAAGQFDIIFLDILMADLNGMETARRIRERACGRILIFISSSPDHVWDSYEVEAFWYLLKPVSEKKLEQVLRRAVVKAEERPEEYLVIQKERKPRKLFLRDIFYFEIRGRVMELHGTDGVLPYYGQMGELENQLLGRGFFRCHKSFLVNLRYVDTYNHQEVVMENGERLPIARRRYDTFRQALLEDMKERGGLV